MIGTNKILYTFDVSLQCSACPFPYIENINTVVISGVRGTSVFVLFSLVNKETPLGLVIGQNLGRWGDRTEFCKEESRARERAAMDLPGQTC